MGSANQCWTYRIISCSCENWSLVGIYRESVLCVVGSFCITGRKKNIYLLTFHV
jgi:hypothetical protein